MTYRYIIGSCYGHGFRAAVVPSLTSTEIIRAGFRKRDRGVRVIA